MRVSLSKLFTLACFAVWIGGFTFYAAVVVPVGTDILGSARAQGEITQVVTNWLNLFSAVALLAMGFDWWSDRNRRRKNNGGGLGQPRRWWAMGSTLAFMIGLLIVLAVLHPQLDRLIEPTESGDAIRLSDRKQFYSLHRVYLWTNTLQWLMGWVWLALFVHDLVKPPRTTN